MPPEYGGQAHELQLRADARRLLLVRNVVELGEDKQVLVAGERAVHRNRLRHITNGAANLHRLSGDGESAHARFARGRRQERGEHLDGGALACPVGAKQAEHLAGIGCQSERIDRRERAEAAGKSFDFNNRTDHRWILHNPVKCVRFTIAHIVYWSGLIAGMISQAKSQRRSARRLLISPVRGALCLELPILKMLPQRRRE
jgi:hypothetical protein